MMTLVRLGEAFNTLPNMACAGRGIQPAVRCGCEKRCAAALRTSLLKIYTSNRSAKVIQSPYTGKVSVETTLGFLFFIIFYFSEVGERSQLLAFLTIYFWKNERANISTKLGAVYPLSRRGESLQNSLVSPGVTCLFEKIKYINGTVFSFIVKVQRLHAASFPFQKIAGCAFMVSGVGIHLALRTLPRFLLINQPLHRSHVRCHTVAIV